LLLRHSVLFKSKTGTDRVSESPNKRARIQCLLPRQETFLNIDRQFPVRDEIFPDCFCRELLQKWLQYGHFSHRI
jgi:hypothetical protein